MGVVCVARYHIHIASLRFVRPSTYIPILSAIILDEVRGGLKSDGVGSLVWGSVSSWGSGSWSDGIGVGSWLAGLVPCFVEEGSLVEGGVVVALPLVARLWVCSGLRGCLLVRWSLEGCMSLVRVRWGCASRGNRTQTQTLTKPKPWTRNQTRSWASNVVP